MIKNLRSSKTAKLFASFLLCCALLPAITRAQYSGTLTFGAGSPSGLTAFPSTADAIPNNSLIVLYSDVLAGGPTGNNPLLSFVGTTPSFTMMTDSPDHWWTVTCPRSQNQSNFMRINAGTYTIRLVNIIVANNKTNGSNGAGIIFATNGNVTTSDTVTLTGTMLFLNNVAGNSNGLGTASFGGALNQAGGNTVLSGSIAFIGNIADRGGAINFQMNSAANGDFYGDILFRSNTANTAGAIGSIIYQSATMTFHDLVRFENNSSLAGNFGNVQGGGAIGTAGANSVTDVSAAGLAFTGTAIFSANTSQSVGGAISFGGQTLYIGGNTKFINNLAGGKGGAIYQYNGMAGSAQVAGGVSIILDSTTGDIIFQGNTENKGTTLAGAGNPNAMSIYSGAYTTGGGTTTLTLNTAAGHTIYFYDPISVTDTTNSIAAANKTWVNVNVTGNGLVQFDKYQNLMASGTTTIQSGTMLLTNGAIYGTGTATSGLVMYLQPGGVLAANNGTILADTIAYDPGAQVSAVGGGTLSLLASSYAGTGLGFTGNGTIDTGGKPVTVSLLGGGGALTIPATTPLTLEAGGTIGINMYGGMSSDHVTVGNFSFTPGNAYVSLAGTSGTYNIFTTLNSTFLAGDFTILVNGLVPTARYAAVPTVTNVGAGSELSVAYSAQNLNVFWAGAAGGTWANTQNANANWTDNATLTPVENFFMNGDGVTFDNTASVKTVTIASAGVVVTSMTVANDAGSDYTFGGAGGITTTNAYAGAVVTPDGKLTKSGAGALNFTNTGPNTFSAGINVSAGTLGFTNGAQLGDGGNGIHLTGDAALRALAATSTLANNLNVDAGKTLTLDAGAAANTLTYTGALNVAATGTLAKIGAGTLKITSDNSANTAATLVNQGALSIDGAAAKLGGTINVANAALLGGGGAAIGTVNGGSGAIIYPGLASTAATPATLTVGTLNLNSSILRFNLFSTGANDMINVTTLNALGTNTVDISMFQSGTFNLGNLGALAGTQVTIGGMAQATGARQIASVVNDGAGNLLLETSADQSRILYWTGVTSGTWTTGDANWTDRASVNLFAGGDRVIFDDSAAATAPRDIFNAGNNINVSDMIVSASSNYSFTGAGITADPNNVIAGSVITGTGKLTKAGSGTLAFANGANNFTGGIEIDAGAITYTDAVQLGDGGNGILFGGNSALVNASGTDQTLINDITVAAGVTGTLDAGANNLTLAGALAAAGGSATLAKVGTGTLALTGVSTAAGAANLTIGIGEGTILLNNTVFPGIIDAAANATVQGAAGSVNTASLRLAAGSTLAGAGSITGNAVLNGTVNANITNAAGMLVLGGAITGAGGYLKTGAGELQLYGIDTLRNTGLSQIDQGTLRINGVSGAISGTTITYGGVADITNSGSTVIMPSNTFTVAGSTFVIPGGTYAVTGLTVDTGNGVITGGYFVIPSSTYRILDPVLTPSASYTVSGSTVVIPATVYNIPGSVFSIGGTVTTTLDASATTVSFSSFPITIPDISIASTVRQNIVVNGGTLAFGAAGAGAGIPSESTANDWAGVNIIQGDNAATSAVTGANDVIHVGSGTMLYAVQNGIIVAVNAGAGATVLGNPANNFTGLVRVDSGTFVATSSAGLGSLGAFATGNNTSAKVALNGGTFEIGYTGSTSRAIELRKDGTVIVDGGVNTQWQAINRPAGVTAANFNGTFTKAGSGTFTLNAAFQATNLVVEEGRFVVFAGQNCTPGQGGGSNPRPGFVNVYTGATFELAATGTGQSGTLGFIGGQPYTVLSAGTITSQFTGGGTLAISNNRYMFTALNNDISNVVITGTNSGALVGSAVSPSSNFGTGADGKGTIVVDQGSLIIGGVSGTLGNVILKNGATFGFMMNASTINVTGSITDTGTTVYLPNLGTLAQAFKTATIKSLTYQGGGAASLYFNTNLALGRADRLVITDAPVSGTFAINVTNYGNTPAQFHSALQLVDAQQGLAASSTFTIATPVIEAGLFKYTVSSAADADGGVSVIVNGTGALSSSASLINSMAATLPLSWFTELNSVQQRMGELHFENRDDKAGAAGWVRGYADQINYNSKVTGTPFGERHITGEAGFDYKVGGTPYNIYLGAFAGYGQSQRNNVPGDAGNQSVFGGVYQTVSSKSGWYVDGLLKANSFTNNFTAIAPTGETATASWHSWAIGASLEVGKYTDAGYGWFITPQIQGAFTILKDKTYTTSSSMSVESPLATVGRARVGFMFGRTYEFEKWGTLNAYVKAYGGGQWTASSRLYVTTVDGNTTRFTPVIKGYNLEGGAGISWQFTKATQVYFDYDTTNAEYYIKPWGLNLGIRHTW